jgi:hypothetical protein
MPIGPIQVGRSPPIWAFLPALSMFFAPVFGASRLAVRIRVTMIAESPDADGYDPRRPG